MIDGGIRTGADAVKALALGAKAVGIGRPALYANGTHGEEGVKRVINSKCPLSSLDKEALPPHMTESSLTRGVLPPSSFPRRNCKHHAEYRCQQSSRSQAGNGRASRAVGRTQQAAIRALKGEDGEIRRLIYTCGFLGAWTVLSFGYKSFHNRQTMKELGYWALDFDFLDQ